MHTSLGPKRSSLILTPSTKISVIRNIKYKTGELISRKYWGANIIERNNEKKEKVFKNASCKIKVVLCKICNKPFVVRSFSSKKTCNEQCRVIASTKARTYQNGSKKPSWYFNRQENKKVLLESSWEVRIAELLDELNIRWIRPKTIK